MENLILIKTIISIIFVLGLSYLAERVSPKIAGILSGYPTGSAVILFFFGLEFGVDFASTAALSNMVGIFGALSFIYFYYRFSLIFKNIIITSTISFIGYLIVAYVLQAIVIDVFVAIIIPVLGSLLFLELFKEVKNNKIERKKLTLNSLIFRGAVATAIIVTITELGSILGPQLSGLISSFPTTFFPVMLIIHYTYKRENLHTLLKNFPIGSIALVLFSLTISIVFPIIGIYFGILIAFFVATIYLIIYKILEGNSIINITEMVK